MSGLVDSHCHLNFEKFKADYRAVIKRCSDLGMRLVVPGSQHQTSQRAFQIAQEYETVFAAVGLHPTHVDDEAYDRGAYELLARSTKVVAIGEIGLDRFRLPQGQAGDQVFSRQIDLFEKQLALAEALDKPVIMHCRAAYEEQTAYLEKRGLTIGSVIHCFQSTPSILKRYLELGCYVGFTGVITFKNAESDLIEAVRLCPIERLLVETDSPYLAPEPHRGQRNEPAYVEFVARKVAEIKKLEYEEVVKATKENAERLFNLANV